MNENTSTNTAPSLRLRLLLVVCALAVVSQLYLPLPVLAQIARALDVDAATAAGALSIFGLFYAAGFMVFGPLSDRLGRRRVMCWGLAALMLVTLLVAALVTWTPSAPLLLACRALQGLAAAAFPPVAIAYLAERGTPGQRIWNVAWISTAFLSAGLLGQLYGDAVAGRWGLGMAMLPLAAIYACTAWALRQGPAEPSTELAPRSARELLSSYRALGPVLADARLRRVYAPALLLLMCFIAFYMALDTRAGAALRAADATPFMARAVALPGFLAPLLVPALMPRLGAERLVAVGLATATTGLLLCAWAGPERLHGLLAASVVFVAGVGISAPSLIARIGLVAAPSSRGLAVALYTFVLFIGASLGPWLAHQTAQLSLSALCAGLAAGLGAAAVYASTARAATPARDQPA